LRLPKDETRCARTADLIESLTDVDTPAAPAYIRCVRDRNEKMTKGTFGDNLKREREMRGVSLEEIATATRIAPRFLRAIENEQWEQLPGGVFNRGFVRAVARYLGLDEESIVAEYALMMDDRPSVPVWTGRPPALPPDRPWLGWILAAVVVTAVVAGGWFAARRIMAWRAARRAARSTMMAAPAFSGTPELSIVNAAPTLSRESDSNAPAGSMQSHSAEPNPGYSAPGAAAMPGNPALLVLKIKAEKKTKVTLDADTDELFSGTMQEGDIRVYSAKDRFDVSARDAGALLLELNGKTLAPIGPPGKAGKVTLTREALKGATGGTN
jgi:cytoskeletal protein RodZ